MCCWSPGSTRSRCRRRSSRASEFAGVITEIAGNTGDFAVGDRVTGTGLFGAFAEQVCVGTDALSPIPDGIDDRSAAAAGVAFRTAYHALRSTARVTAGDEVVVLGAGGGVGLAAVALGTALGARVTAVASSAEKLSAAARYGAARGVNHGHADLRETLREALPDGATAVIDPVGGELSEPALRSPARGGRFVTVGFASGRSPHPVESGAGQGDSVCWDFSSRTCRPMSSPATRQNCAGCWQPVR